jgi:aryl-alcohol dehydrogenase-like predicted oxidoreductase
MAQGGRRERIVLATKVYGAMGEGPNDRRLTAYHIRRACEDSLCRLQTDHIDLYQMHHIDRTVPWEEIWQVMEQLVREGKVLYIGSSNFAGWQIVQAKCLAAARLARGLRGALPRARRAAGRHSVGLATA